MTNDEPRLLSRAKAATYCGITRTAFSKWVKAGVMPQTLSGTRRWDKNAIDARLDEISGLASADAQQEDDFEKWSNEREARKTQRAGKGKKDPR